MSQRRLVGLLITALAFPGVAPTPAAALETTQPLGGLRCLFHVPPVLSGGLPPDVAVTWTGLCVDGVVSGQGTLRGLHDNRQAFSYEGSARDGWFDGHGLLRYTPGQALNPAATGAQNLSVTLITPDTNRPDDGTTDDQGVNTYDGTWQVGKRDGVGSASWSNGNRYVGNWREDATEGQGTFSYASGDRYVGASHAGWADGPGTWFYANGDRAEMTFKAGEPTPPTSFTAHSGLHYEGMFDSSGFAGQGVMTTPDGDRYSGNWHGGKPDGEGTLTKRNGTILDGTWTHGCLLETIPPVAFRTDPTTCIPPP